MIDIVRGAPHQRRRTVANFAAAALGANVWVSTVLLPALATGAWSSNRFYGIALAPIAVLLLGILRRAEGILLFAFPASLFIPLAIRPDLASAHVYTPVRFALVAAGVLAYLFFAALFTSPEDTPPPPGKPQKQPVTRAEQQNRRILAFWSASAFLIAVFLVYAAQFSDRNREFLHRMFPDRHRGMSALIGLGVLALWVFLYGKVFLPLFRERQRGDPELRAFLLNAHSEALRGRPRTGFYVGVLAALLFISLLLLLRYSHP